MMFRRWFASFREAVGTTSAVISLVAVGGAVGQLLLGWVRWLVGRVLETLFRVEAVSAWVWLWEALALFVFVFLVAVAWWIWAKRRAAVNRRRLLVGSVPLGFTDQENRLIEAMRGEPDACPLDVATAAYIRSEFRAMRRRDDEILRRLSRIEALLEKDDSEITRRLVAIEAAVSGTAPDGD